MISDGAKEIKQNSMHVRIPNSFIKRETWLNLSIDLNSITKEVFNPQIISTPSDKLNRAKSRGAPIDDIVFKQIDYVQLEGSFKLKKIFSARNQIPSSGGDPLFNNED